MENNSGIKRVLYFDILTILSAIGVISLHSSETFFTFRTDTSWYISLFIQCLFSFCVPIFFMISGANLIGYKKRYSTKEFFVKRIKKVVLPFIIWSILWYLFNGLYSDYYSISLMDFISRFSYEQVEVVLWFLYTLITLYILTPLLSLISENKNSDKYFIGIFLLFFFSKSIVWLIFNLINQPVPIVLNFIDGNQYLAYYILGYLMKRKEYLKSIKTYILLILVLIIVSFTFISSIYLCTINQTALRTIFIFDSPFCYMYSALIWIIISRLNTKDWSNKMKNLIVSISSSCFGIYLLHMAIERIVWHQGIANLNNAFWFLLFIPINFVISLALVKTIRNIPIIKLLVP